MSGSASTGTEVSRTVAGVAGAALDWLDEPIVVVAGVVVVVVALWFAVRRLVDRVLRRTPWGS